MAFDFSELEIPGIILVSQQVHHDARGFFCETYRKSDFAANGISLEFVQDNHSFSTRGVIRGLHYQLPPHAQGKLVSVVHGRIWDVAVDIRRESPTFGKWIGQELSEENNRMFWIPPGFAHGFIAMSESATMLYKCTAEYHMSSEAGIRWDDPDLDIRWPLEDPIVSARDAALPSFADAVLF